MKMTEIKQKARTVGVAPGKMKKTDLVRAIQAREGYETCFQSNANSCEQTECCWRGDCLTC